MFVGPVFGMRNGQKMRGTRNFGRNCEGYQSAIGDGVVAGQRRYSINVMESIINVWKDSGEKKGCPYPGSGEGEDVGLRYGSDHKRQRNLMRFGVLTLYMIERNTGKN